MSLHAKTHCANGHEYAEGSYRFNGCYRDCLICKNASTERRRARDIARGKRCKNGHWIKANHTNCKKGCKR